MDIKIVVVGPLETNCYIIIQNGECLIIDPGFEANKIKNVVSNNIVKGILITHHHFDHVGALEELKNYYQVAQYDIHNLEEGKHELGNFSFEVIYTPGHKEDSISFLFPLDQMFVGDFIFKDSIGRTDLEGGDFDLMKQSIHKIKQYSDEIQIYPGHGPSTTLKEEKQNNVFFS